MRFVSGSGSVIASTVSVAVSQPFTANGVGKRTSNFTSAQTVLGGSAGAFFTLGWQSSTDTVRYQDAAVATASATDNLFHSLTASNASNTANALNFNVDGTQNLFTPNFTSGTNSMGVGGYGYGNAMDGDAFEAGLWPSAFTNTQCNNLSSNQHSYWGF
jgi:hypothetical protein